MAQPVVRVWKSSRRGTHRSLTALCVADLAPGERYGGSGAYSWQILHPGNAMSLLGADVGHVGAKTGRTVPRAQLLPATGRPPPPAGRPRQQPALGAARRRFPRGAADNRQDAVDGPILTTVTILGATKAMTYASQALRSWTRTASPSCPGVRPVTGGPSHALVNADWVELGGTGIARTRPGRQPAIRPPAAERPRAGLTVYSPSHEIAFPLRRLE